MRFFITDDGTKLFYKDIGEGAPVILIHGWPLSCDMWDEQALALLEAGFRVISYDRRGFGKSEQPSTGYDYDTFAGDLNDLIQHLGLEKVSLVGFSMGGGEIARYLSHYGSERISSACLVSAITPIVMKTKDNSHGVPEEKIQEIEAGVRKDRFTFFHNFFKDFYGVSAVHRSVAPQVLLWAESVATQASLLATVKCVNAFARTDFRGDMKAFTIPTMIIHGTGDKTVPIETSADQAAQMIPSAQYKKYEGAPHGLNLSHKERLNQDLVSFLKEHASEVISPKRREVDIKGKESARGVH